MRARPGTSIASRAFLIHDHLSSQESALIYLFAMAREARRYSRMAIRMFAIASSLSFPWLQQPGNSGQETL
jgi:hypothetical protein